MSTVLDVDVAVVGSGAALAYLTAATGGRVPTEPAALVRRHRARGGAR